MKPTKYSYGKQLQLIAAAKAYLAAAALELSEAGVEEARFGDPDAAHEIAALLEALGPVQNRLENYREGVAVLADSEALAAQK